MVRFGTKACPALRMMSLLPLVGICFSAPSVCCGWTMINSSGMEICHVGKLWVDQRQRQRQQPHKGTPTKRFKPVFLISSTAQPHQELGSLPKIAFPGAWRSQLSWSHHFCWGLMEVCNTPRFCWDCIASWSLGDIQDVFSTGIA